LITATVTVLFALWSGDAVGVHAVRITSPRLASLRLASPHTETRGKSKLDEDLRERRQIGCYGNLIA